MPPRFIKIDIEGAEYDCLEVASLLLSAYRPKLYVEVSNDNSKTCF